MEMYWTNASERLKEVAGPLLLERIVVDYPEVKLLEPAAFFPATPEEREDAIAVHHMARVWHNTTTLRAAMLRAEKRLEKAGQTGSGGAGPQGDQAAPPGTRAKVRPGEDEGEARR